MSVEDIRNYFSHIIYILNFDFFLNFLLFVRLQTPTSLTDFSSNIFYCLCTTESTNNGVGLQVLTTLVTALPLKHIQNVQH